MPRRGRSSPMSSAPRISAPPSRPMSTMPAPPPAMHPPAHHAPTAQPKQPGLMAQMATTAAGVAVGSAVGHTIGHAMTGGGGGGGAGVPAQAQGYPQQQQMYSPCQEQLQQFVDCAQSQSDLNMCQGLNEALRQCRMQYGALFYSATDLGVSPDHFVER